MSGISPKLKCPVSQRHGWVAAGRPVSRSRQGAGLASVLIVIGLLIVGARKTLDGFALWESWLRGIPLVSSAVVAILGAAISWQAFSVASAFK